MEYSPIYSEEIQVESTKQGPFPDTIETDRLFLKPLLDFSPEDIQKHFKENTNASKYFTTSTRFPQTVEDMYNYFELIENLEEKRDDRFYAILDKTDDGIFSGCATIEEFDLHALKCNIGIWLTKEMRGRGFSQERAEGLIYAIFKETPIKTVGVRVATENDKSIKSVLRYMKEFGGNYNGKLKDDSITPEREVIDVFCWSISKREFLDPESEYNNQIEKPENIIRF